MSIVLNPLYPEYPYIQKKLNLNGQFLELVKTQNWNFLDELIFKSLNEGEFLYKELSQYIRIRSHEHIISVRSHPDEDGIWHGDGSRELAFTLSLSPSEVVGGELEIKGKSDSFKIASPSFGVLTIFKTGESGYLHRVLKVLKGNRVIIAGWIN